MVEIIAVCAIVVILVSITILYADPGGQKKRARDEKRLSDISVIDRAINEFLLDHKRYPDQENTLRRSNTLPEGGSHISNSNLGWILDDLSSYASVLPVDPVNDENYYYSYVHNSVGYELNVILEILMNEMVEDGGNDPNRYEIGNNLNLISP